LAAKYEVGQFVFASSSSVYGKNTAFPSTESALTQTPISLYAATKLAGEAMVHSFSYTHKLAATILRFFNVYGPWVRPDMALFIFTKKILQGLPIDVYNYGQSAKDFTYIDDTVAGVVAALTNVFPFEIFNLGNSHPVELKRYISLLEQALGKTAEKNYLPLQLGDVPKSFADISKARRMLGYHPKIAVEEGIDRFVAWYKEYRVSLDLDKM
jgi:UDP-glucuronate 4-epimerase